MPRMNPFAPRHPAPRRKSAGVGASDTISKMKPESDPLAPTFPPRAPVRLALAAAMVCGAVFASSISLMLPVLALGVKARGESFAIIGLFGAQVGMGQMLVSFFAPGIVRKFGAKHTMVFALIAYAALCPLYKLTGDMEDYLAAWFAIHSVAVLAGAALFIVAEAIVAALAPAKRRGFVLGIYAAGFSLGFAAGPALILITGESGWPPFLTASGLSLAAAIFVLTVSRGNTALPPPPRRTAFRIIWRRTKLPFVCAFTVGAMETAIYGLLPPHAASLDFAAADAALLLTFFSIGAIALQAPLGIWGDRFGVRRTIAVCALLSAAGALGLPLMLSQAGGGTGWGWWVALVGVWGGFVLVAYPLGLAEAARAFQPHRLTAASAMFAMCYGMGALLGPTLAGSAMDVWPENGLALVLATIALLPLFACGKRKSRAG